MAPSGGSFEADNQMASFLTTTQAALEMKKKGSNIYSLKTDDRLTKKAEEQAAKVSQVGTGPDTFPEGLKSLRDLLVRFHNQGPFHGISGINLVSAIFVDCR